MIENQLERLRELNPQLDIKSVCDPVFAAYGRVIEDAGLAALMAYLRENTPVAAGTAYTASDPQAEALPVYKSLRRRWFGGMDIQIGWCNGTNDRLNALEYHASIEINVAAADAVLLLAKIADCEDGQVNTAAVRGFYLRTGEAVLLDSATLHFAPCAVNETGFRMAVILPRGTNTPLPERTAADQPLWMVNKWLLAHREATHFIEAGAFEGLTGPFLTLRR